MDDILKPINFVFNDPIKFNNPSWFPGVRETAREKETVEIDPMMKNRGKMPDYSNLDSSKKQK